MRELNGIKGSELQGIIAQFEAGMRQLAELIQRMDGFSEVLNAFNQRYLELVELGSRLAEEQVVESFIEQLSSLRVHYENTHRNLTGLRGMADRLEQTGAVFSDQLKVAEASMERILEKYQALEKTVQQSFEASESLIATMEKGITQAEQRMTALAERLNGIGSACAQNWECLGAELDRNAAIYQAVRTLEEQVEQRNELTTEAFFELCDRWAQQRASRNHEDSQLVE